MTSSRWALRPPPPAPPPRKAPPPSTGPTPAIQTPPPVRPRPQFPPLLRPRPTDRNLGKQPAAPRERGAGRPEKPELGEPSGPRPPSSHGGGRAAAPGAALRAVGALRAAGGPTGQPSRPRPGKDPTGKLRRATIAERGQDLAHPKSVPEGPPHPLPLPGASPRAAAPGADRVPEVRLARRPRACPGPRPAGVRPGSVVGSGCHWCTPWGGRRSPGARAPASLGCFSQGSPPWLLASP